MGAEDTAYRGRAMTDGPERIDRRDEGYTVAGRIQSHSSRRGQVGLALVALAVVVWASATVGDRLGVGGDGPGASSSQGTAGSSGQPAPSLGEIPDSGYLPALEERQPGRNAGRLPIVLGGLSWLELAFSRVETALDLSQTQWHFALPYGDTACVCLSTQPTGGRELLLARYGQSDAVQYANPLRDWLPEGYDLTLVDAAVTPDGTGAIVASVVPDDGGRFRLRVERFPLDAGDLIGNDLQSIPIDLGPLGDPGRLTVRVLVAPDGSRARVTLQRLADDLAGITGVERSWSVPIDPATSLGEITEEPPVPDDIRPATCRGSALATASDVVSLCTSLGSDDQGRSDLFLRIDHAGRYRDVALGQIFASGEVIGWQVDGTRGLVYVWQAFAHRIQRVTVSTGSVKEAVLGDGQGHDLPTNQPPPVGHGFPPPDPVSTTLWQPTDSARDTTANLLAGSVDGQELYAGGLVYPTGPGATGSLDSTGIWVLDTETLRPIAHWAAVAAYQELALSPDGGFLVGVGQPSSSELAQYGNHGPQLVLHDPGDGSVIAIHRSLVLRLGGMPYLLPAPPPDPAVSP